MEYIRALLSPVERKNSWQLAEIAGHNTPKACRTCWVAPIGSSNNSGRWVQAG